MKRRLVLIISVLTFANACSRKDSNRHGDEAQTPPAPAAQRAEGEKGILRIEPEMLRDLKITTAPVEQRPGGEGAILLGELRVNENAYAQVGAPVPSRILALHAAPGQGVATGQALATLQSTELGKTRSELITANARLELARQTLERRRRLASERIASQRELQEAEAGAASAEADVRAARAALQALGVTGSDEGADSSQYVLHSPVRGVVLERQAVKGQLADPAQPLFRIADLGALWLTVQAFERDAVRIKPGWPVRVTFAALPGRTFNGRVALVGSEVSSQSRTIPVRIDVANPERILRPGMSATAWATPGSDSRFILTVPAAALQRFEDDWVVFVPRAQETFEIRRVGRGRELGGEVELLSGVKPGETVVVDGAFLLKAEADKSRGEGEEHEH
jgi:cobalt-zinc-cadmium efflux system membrane fusion protein